MTEPISFKAWQQDTTLPTQETNGTCETHCEDRGVKRYRTTHKGEIPPLLHANDYTHEDPTKYWKCTEIITTTISRWDSERRDNVSHTHKYSWIANWKQRHKFWLEEGKDNESNTGTKSNSNL